MKTKADVLDYIRSVSQDLSTLAEAHHWDMLSYLFRMTKLEADRIAPDARAERLFPVAKAVPGSLGYWEWDLARDRVFSDEIAAGLFNLDMEASRRGTPLSEWQKAIHEDDVHRVADRIKESIATGAEYSARFRVVAADQTTRYVEANGRCLFDPNGRPTRFPGTVRQVQPGAARLSDIDIEIIMQRGQQTH